MFDKIAEYSEIGNYLEKLITKKYKETGDKRYKAIPHKKMFRKLAVYDIIKA